MSALAKLTVAHPALDAALVSGMGQHHTNLDRTKSGVFYKGQPYTTVSLADIFDMAANPPSVPKEKAQWFIPSNLPSRVHAWQRDQGQFYALWADFDEPTTTISETHGICRDAVGTCCLTYASRSATQEKQKARIIIPLNEPCDGPTFVVLQTILNDRLAKAGLIPDRASQRVGQLCYLPNRGEFYSFEISQDIGLLDWRVAFAADMEAARIEQAAQAAAQAAQMERARVQATQRIAIGQTSPIDAFNHGYDVALLLNQYGYLQKGNRWLSPNSSSETPGVVIKGNRWISSHGSDAGIGKECTSGTSGDAFDLFIHYQCGGDRNAAIRAAGAMFVNSEGKTITQANQHSYMQAQDSVTFDAGDAFSEYPDTPSQTGIPKPTEAMPAPAQAIAPVKPHPLLQTVEIDLEPIPPRWVIPGLIAEGVVLIAGWRGIGKTTGLLPLAMTAAGLHEEGYELAPSHWRHVVYVTEDTAQAMRVIAGYAGHIDLDAKAVRERLHLVEAKRLTPSYLVQAGDRLRGLYTRTVHDVALPPLIVLDTHAATIELESENDNAEASRAISAIKQDFADLPVWMVAHVAKTSAQAKNVADLTTRGAGAFEGDAHQTMYMIEDGGIRYLLGGKTRFEARWREILLEPHTKEISAANAFGDYEPLTLRWAIARPQAVDSRIAAAEQAKEARQKEDAAQLRDGVRHAIDVAWQSGGPLNRSGVVSVVGRKRADVLGCIEMLISERWLLEIEIPRKDRVHPRKSHFLVNLSTPEHDAVMAGKPVPNEKLAIPEGWKKPASSVPDDVGTKG